MSSFSRRRCAGVFHHDAAVLEHVAVVGDVERHVGVLLDQQDRGAALAVDAHTISKISCVSCGDRPRLGSSSSISFGRAISARRSRASAAGRRRAGRPPAWRAPSGSGSSRRPSPGRARRRRGRCACRRPSAGCRRTDSSGNTSRPSGTWLRPRRTIQAGSRRWMSSPLKRTCPLLGSMMPEMVFRIVVLPAPLAPSTVTISPFGHRQAHAAERLDRAVARLRRSASSRMCVIRSCRLCPGRPRSPPGAPAPRPACLRRAPRPGSSPARGPTRATPGSCRARPSAR